MNTSMEFKNYLTVLLIALSPVLSHCSLDIGNKDKNNQETVSQGHNISSIEKKVKIGGYISRGDGLREAVPFVVYDKSGEKRIEGMTTATGSYLLSLDVDFPFPVIVEGRYPDGTIIRSMPMMPEDEKPLPTPLARQVTRLLTRALGDDPLAVGLKEHLVINREEIEPLRSNPDYEIGSDIRYAEDRYEYEDEVIELSGDPESFIQIKKKLGLTGDKPRTISIFLRPLDIMRQDFQFIFSSGELERNKAFGLFLGLQPTLDGKPIPGFTVNTYNFFGFGLADYRSKTDASLEWENIVVRWDGRKLEMFRSGLKTDSMEMELNTEGDGITIGCRHDRKHCFNGYLDEVRLYDRALSDDDIVLLYSTGALSGFLTVTANPVTEYLLHDIVGDDIRNVAGKQMDDVRQQAHDTLYQTLGSVNLKPFTNTKEYAKVESFIAALNDSASGGDVKAMMDLVRAEVQAGQGPQLMRRPEFQLKLAIWFSENYRDDVDAIKKNLAGFITEDNVLKQMNSFIDSMKSFNDSLASREFSKDQTLTIRKTMENVLVNTMANAYDRSAIPNPTIGSGYYQDGYNLVQNTLELTGGPVIDTILSNLAKSKNLNIQEQNDIIKMVADETLDFTTNLTGCGMIDLTGQEQDHQSCDRLNPPLRIRGHEELRQLVDNDLKTKLAALDPGALNPQVYDPSINVRYRRTYFDDVFWTMEEDITKIGNIYLNTISDISFTTLTSGARIFYTLEEVIDRSRDQSVVLINNEEYISYPIRLPGPNKKYKLKVVGKMEGKRDSNTISRTITVRYNRLEVDFRGDFCQSHRYLDQKLEREKEFYKYIEKIPTKVTSSDSSFYNNDDPYIEVDGGTITDSDLTRPGGFFRPHVRPDPGLPNQYTRVNLYYTVQAPKRDGSIDDYVEPTNKSAKVTSCATTMLDLDMRNISNGELIVWAKAIPSPDNQPWLDKANTTKASPLYRVKYTLNMAPPTLEQMASPLLHFSNSMKINTTDPVKDKLTKYTIPGAYWRSHKDGFSYIKSIGLDEYELRGNFEYFIDLFAFDIVKVQLWDGRIGDWYQMYYSQSKCPYCTWDISPDLPPGLTLDSTVGSIHGLPGFTLVGQQKTYRITATNPGGSVTKEITFRYTDSLLVAGAGNTYKGVGFVPKSETKRSYLEGETTLSYPAYVISSGDPVNIEVSGWRFTASGSDGVTRYSADNLPSTLTLDPDTGVITGTVYSIQEETPYRICIDNVVSRLCNIMFALKVEPDLPLWKGVNPATNTLTQFVALTVPIKIEVSGNVIDTYSITPELPAGLVLNTVSGEISGTPTVDIPNTIYTASAGNAFSSVSGTFSLEVSLAPPRNLVYKEPTTRCTEGEKFNGPLDVASVEGTVTGYSISPELPNLFQFNTLTGRIDNPYTCYRSMPLKEYTITASNSVGSTVTTWNLEILPAAPSKLSYGSGYKTITVGYPASIGVYSIEGGEGISYSIDPPLPLGLGFSTETGQIDGTMNDRMDLTKYIVTATNVSGSISADLWLTVSERKPEIAYNCGFYSSCAFNREIAITALIPKISTWSTGLNFSVTPTLPEGLNLDNASGVISGTPKQILASTAQYTISATNADGSSIANLFIRIIDTAPSGLTYSQESAVYTIHERIPDNSVANIVGTIEGYSLVGLGSGSVVPLPEGLSFDNVTGVISGIPTKTQGLTSYRITASNTGGETSTRINITIVDQPPTNLVYEQTEYEILVNNPSPPIRPSRVDGTGISWISTPPLPAGLFIDQQSGAIDGIPSALQAKTAYTITATNKQGSASADIFLTITDKKPTTIYYNPAEWTFTRLEFSRTFAVRSLGSGITYSIDPGSPSLPEGMVIDPQDGRIYGYPQVAQAMTEYTVRATNSGGYTTTTVRLAVEAAAPSILTYEVTHAVYEPDTEIAPNRVKTIKGSGLAFSISPDLPIGLLINADTGTISGTAVGIIEKTEFVVTATNSDGTATATITIAANNDPPADLTYNPAVAKFNVGEEVLISAAITGGVSSWSIAPALPEGFIFDNTTGEITGIAVGEQLATTYTVTAANKHGSVDVEISIEISKSGFELALLWPGCQEVGGGMNTYRIYQKPQSVFEFNDALYFVATDNCNIGSADYTTWKYDGIHDPIQLTSSSGLKLTDYMMVSPLKGKIFVLRSGYPSYWFAIHDNNTFDLLSITGTVDQTLSLEYNDKVYNIANNSTNSAYKTVYSGTDLGPDELYEMEGDGIDSDSMKYPTLFQNKIYMWTELRAETDSSKQMQWVSLDPSTKAWKTESDVTIVSTVSNSTRDIHGAFRTKVFNNKLYYFGYNLTNEKMRLLGMGNDGTVVEVVTADEEHLTPHQDDYSSPTGYNRCPLWIEYNGSLLVRAKTLSGTTVSTATDLWLISSAPFAQRVSFTGETNEYGMMPECLTEYNGKVYMIGNEPEEKVEYMSPPQFQNIWVYDDTMGQAQKLLDTTYRINDKYEMCLLNNTEEFCSDPFYSPELKGGKISWLTIFQGKLWAHITKKGYYCPGQPICVEPYEWSTDYESHWYSYE